MGAVPSGEIMVEEPGSGGVDSGRLETASRVSGGLKLVLTVHIANRVSWIPLAKLPPVAMVTTRPTA
jgi:hypothetical protein